MWVSITTAEPDEPPEPWTAARTTRWVYHCTSRSMVSRRSWPLRGGTVLLSPSGIRLPPPVSYDAEPSLPDSIVSNISSAPSPASPWSLVKPTRLAATSSAG